MNGLEAENREDDGTSVDGSKGVTQGDLDYILDAVLLWIIIGTERDDRTEGEAE